MKKIILIACAAVLAGLLVSCNNGAKDYNSVRYENYENSYLVSGTYTKVVTTDEATYGATDQATGTKSTVTTTEYITSAAAKVTYNTDSEFDSNYQEYAIKYEGSTGYKSIAHTGYKTWNAATKAWVDTASIPADTAKGTGDPDQTVGGKTFTIYSIDDDLYFNYDGKSWPVTADESAFADGNDFTLKFSCTLVNDIRDDINKGTDGKQTGRTTKNNTTTYTYDLTFTAQ